jgi:hypothetical protein
LEQPPKVVEAWQEDPLHLYFWNSLQKYWRLGRRIPSIFTFGTASRRSEGLAGGSSPSLLLEQPPEEVKAWQEDPLHLYFWNSLQKYWRLGRRILSIFTLEQPPEEVKAWQADHLHLYLRNILQKQWGLGRRILSIFSLGTASRRSEGLAGGFSLSQSSRSLAGGSSPSLLWNSLQRQWRLGRRILSIFTFGTSLPLEEPPEVVKAWQEDGLYHLWS